MKRILYTISGVLIATLSASAQTFYDYDSTFNGNGLRTLNASPNHTDVLACFLRNDGTSYVGTGVTNIVGASALEVQARLKANGSFDSTLCGSYCISSAPHDSYVTGIYELRHGTVAGNYYFASSGFGGNVVFNGATSVDDQTYSTSYNTIVSSAKWNDTTVIEAGLDLTTSVILAYRVNAAGTGYAGAPGIINGADFPHGGYVYAFNSTMSSVWVRHVAVQSGSKMIVAGTATLSSMSDSAAFVCRFKPNSLVLDSTFGTNGIVYFGSMSATPGRINAIYVAPDDKVYVHFKESGTSSTTLAALNPNGSINTSFGAGGLISTGTATFSRIRVIDNRIFATLTGSSSSLLQAYKLNGTPDSSFYINATSFGIGSRIPGATGFKANDISSNAANEIMVVGSYMNGSTQEGFALKLKKRTVPVDPVPDAVAATSAVPFSVYPNPANDKLQIAGNFKTAALAVRVVSVTGSVVLVRDLAYGESLDISSLGAGMYYLQANSGTDIHTARFVKQ